MNIAFGLNASYFEVNENDIKTKTFSLNGKWDFYWNKLLSSEQDFENNIPNEIVKTPYRWTTNKKYNSDGCATYRMIISVPNDEIYGLYIPFLEHSYRVFVNGSIVAEDGKVACEKNSYKPGRTSRIVAVASKDKKIDLVVQISSFDDMYAGMQDFITIGRQDVSIKAREKQIAFNVAVLAIISIMAIYNLMMFLIRRKDLSFLIFFLLSMIIVFRLIFSDFMAKWIFPSVGYDTIFRFAFLSMVLTPLFLLMFTRYFFYSEKAKSNMLRVSVVYTVPISIFITFAPVQVFAKFLYLYQIGVIVIPFFAIYHLVRAVVQKLQGARSLLIATVVLILFAVNDILYTNGIINTGYIIPSGLVIFILFQSFVLAKKFNKISELSIRDPLTSCYNKRYLLEYLNEIINDRRKDSEKIFSVAILDIDYFKNVNDTHGHDFGDYVLKIVANTIVESIRGYDVFARYGGEEFVIVFNNLNIKDSYYICERIREKIEQLKIEYENKSIRDVVITVSMGLVNYQKGKHLNYNQIIKAADDCLYRAKNSGRNKVVVADFDN